SGRNASRSRHLHAARGDDRAQVRRKVRERGLSDLGRVARRRCDGGEFPLRMVRGRSPPRRACLSAGIRARRGRDRGPPHRHVTTLRRIGTSEKVGPKTTFKPAPQTSPITKFTYNTLYRRLQELAFLNRGIKIVFKDERAGDGETFQYQRGILEFVEHLNRAS